MNCLCLITGLRAQCGSTDPSSQAQEDFTQNQTVAESFHHLQKTNFIFETTIG